MKALIWAVTIPAATLLLLWLDTYLSRRRLSRRMAGREALSDALFAARFYPEDAESVAVRIRRILAKHLLADLSRLHPTDRIREDLRLGAGDGLDEVEFLMEVEDEFGISITEEDPVVTAVDDLVELVRGKLDGQISA